MIQERKKTAEHGKIQDEFYESTPIEHSCFEGEQKYGSSSALIKWWMMKIEKKRMMDTAIVKKNNKAR